MQLPAESLMGTWFVLIVASCRGGFEIQNPKRSFCRKTDFAPELTPLDSDQLSTIASSARTEQAIIPIHKQAANMAAVAATLIAVNPNDSSKNTFKLENVSTPPLPRD